jgi:hypothetical protein
MASHRRFWLLIPAAGESQRFREHGINTPKPLLTVRSRGGQVCSMLAHVLATAPFTRTIVGLRHPWHLPEDARGCDVVHIQRTRSHADTVRQMLEHVPPDDAVMIMDCDTIMVPEDLEAMTAYEADVVIAVARSDDPEMSRVDAVPFPSRFEDKWSDLPYGVISARMFHESGHLKNCLRDTFSDTLAHYGQTTRAHLVTSWQDWGTPEKLRATGAEMV